MTMPLGKLAPHSWLATNATQRDAIGSGERLAVGDTCSVQSPAALSICLSVDGASASTWTDAGGSFRDVYEIDFSTLENGTIKSDTTHVIDGKTWTIANSASATAMDVWNGTGIVLVHGTGATNINGSTESAPLLYADLSELDATADPSDEWRLYVFFEVADADASAEHAAMGFRAGNSWNATKNSALRLHGYGGVGADQFTLNVTGAAQTDGIAGQTPAARPSTDRVMIMDLLSGGGRVVNYSGITYSGGWPATSAWKRIASAHWSVQSEIVDDLGPDFQVMLGVYDTSAGDAGPTATFKRLLLQKRSG